MTAESQIDVNREAKVDRLAIELFGILSALPRRNDSPQADEKVRKWARLIAQSTPWDSPFPNGMKQAKRSVIQKELNDFARSVKNAERALLKFHNPSFGKALEAGTSAYDLKKSLTEVLNFAEAIERISLDDVPEKIVRGREHDHADFIAQKCSMYFFWITGRHPGRMNKDGASTQSAFEIFLQHVFDIMDIDASVDERARKAAAGFKRVWGKRSRSSDR